MKRLVHIPELYLAVVLLILLAFAAWNSPEISNVRFHQGSIEREVELPFARPISDHRPFYVDLEISRGIGTNFSLKIIPDDCLEALTVGGVEVSLDSIEGLCDYTNGFVVDAKRRPPISGKTVPISMKLRNRGGPGGVAMDVLPQGFLLRTLQTLLIVSFLSLIALVLCRLRLSKPLIALVLLSTLFHIFYAMETPYSVRSHDVDGHVGYVEFIADRLEIPGVDDCWTCYHPPVYYAAMAPVWKGAESLGFSPRRAVQWATLALSVVLVAAGTLSLQLLMRGPALAIAVILWAFWPVLFMISPRIGNDQMFFAAHAICFVSTLGYMLKQKTSCLLLGAIACWIAFWSKSTGTITIGIWIVGFLLGYFPRENLLPKKGEWASLGILFALCVTILLRFVLGNDLVGNASGLNSGLRVGIEPKNFLYFDLPGFLTTTYTSAWHDEGGRQFFWNYLAKTSLFGEFPVRTDSFGNSVAAWLNLSFVGLVIFAFVGFWKRRIDRFGFLLLVQAGLFTLAMVVLRLRYPYSCSSDFRYILPVLLSFLPYVGWGICKEGASVKWKVCGGLCVFIFALSSCVLYLSL